MNKMGPGYLPVKAQSKKHSLFEALINIAVGIGLSYILNQVILVHVYGYQMSLGRNAIITFWFTVASILRSYLLRRFFNWRTERRLSKLPIGWKAIWGPPIILNKDWVVNIKENDRPK